MGKKLKNYRVKPSTSDVFAVSLVEEAAVESNFIALSKQTPMDFKIQNEEKRMLYGVALRADFPIYRRYGDEEFYLTFDKNAIERLVNKFMSNYGQRNFTIDHMEPAEGIVITESWIVKDVKNDKAAALGLENFSEGSWIIGTKINNDEIWQSIKEGRWSGFSIESWIDMEEIEDFKKINKENKNIDMAKKSKFEEMIDKIKEIISDAVTEADGQDTEVQEEVIEEAADAVEEVVNEEETTEEVVEAAEDETPNEEIVNDVVDTVQEETETTEEAVDNLQEIIDGLKDEVDALKKENEELKKKNQKMSKQPSTKVVKANSETKKTGVKAAFEALKAQGIIS